jgi:octaprenyl-diphosphate synthase
MDKTTVADTLQRLFRPILADLERVEAELALSAPSANPLLKEIGGYLFGLGGKRIRPALLLLGSRLFGPPRDEAVFWSAMIETIHAASLIHDDIVDEADRRRGSTTLHLRWGTNITVLLGDYLYIQTIQRSLRTRRHGLIDILADVTARMVEGELVEASWRGRTDIPEPVYLDILDKKTSSLFAGACRIGAEIGGASADQAESLGSFGLSLGRCFQIIDDWLDYAGEPGSLGKPVLSDLREGRATLPLIRCLERLPGPDRDRLREAAGRLAAGDAEAGPPILDQVRRTGALEATLEEARRSADKAGGFLEGLPEGEARAALAGLIDVVLERNQ